ncbi:hypothetical protein [Photobacterium alginatilyticum]|uniref:hypothetical protein n=1 Tax=Photobacterium alginatilyticum TaxID=1775171 RepID=UPI0030841454
MEVSHYPYFIYVDSELAGFALVRRYPSNPAIYDMGQFFVLRKFKGQGVGNGYTLSLQNDVDLMMHFIQFEV